ncbi:MAG: DNA polymerase III subunit alpha [Saprospiraceae bacterium]|nr:DNA polymerase III subunit alpha [Saprospiraceae bacterium]
MPEFCHLHCHTQYSLLDGATEIPLLMQKAKKDGMKAVAMTDHGNMFGAFSFVKEAKKNGIKPILGCEFYLVKDRRKQSFQKSMGESDERFHQLLLAKNQEGYRNLSKLCSLGYIEGLYGKYPRIDKELLLNHHEGLIATSCCIGAEIPQALLKGNDQEAETLLKWWLNLFGEDFYIEIQRQQGNENIDQTGISLESVNQKLLILARKYKVKVIATNDVHYLEQEDSVPHDILLCVNTASFENELNRFRFPSNDYFFKTSAEMEVMFADLPLVLDQTQEIADKCFTPDLERNILLPSFPIPQNFKNETEYLRHLVFEGAKSRYSHIDSEIEHRLNFELEVIEKMKFQGYFLIVQDFIKEARRRGVSVGPGRGSAAGSAVAYCLTITDIDPIKYNLLFERFLNPERISMPDIDIDFDDKGRDKVLEYVVNKYGHSQVAQIVTFGTMAAKSSIRDVARVKRLELSIADRLAKMVPSKPGVYLKDLLNFEKDISSEFNSEEKSKVLELRNIAKENNLEAEVVNTALKLEGSVRNTGVHAAGVIIAPDEIMNYIPVCTAKDTNLWVTQVEGSVIEATGLLKMDFLGLTTLTIIDETLKHIQKKEGPDFKLDLHSIPLDDPETLKLFENGNTIGLFQFESDGMRAHLKNLKPSGIEDLIAMNALFRPGPMDYITDFISRKHGRVEVIYPHEWLVDILKPTYGIMVYQEQIMQTAQIMADYSLGEADILRRIMGKKKKEEMAEQKKLFVERAIRKGVSEENAQNIFDVMAKFASYGFNRSHSAAYSVLSFQTGWLKAHYPAEYMSAVLTANKSNIESMRAYLLECSFMKVKVLGPDINESELDFTVNESGQIRFGLSALKGIGEGPVEEILEERKKGKFLSFVDMIKRLKSKSFNKKVIESCVYGGAFDNFKVMHRAQFFAPIDKFETYIEYMLRWGQQYHNSTSTVSNSLFGDSVIQDIKPLLPPQVAEWDSMRKLTYELQIAGIYLSSHPLDNYQREIKHAATLGIDQIEDNKEKIKERKIRLCGLISEVQHRTNKKGEGFGIFTLEDYQGSINIRVFREEYLKFKELLESGTSVFVEGIYAKNSWNKNEEVWEFKVSHIGLLSSVLDYISKKFTVYINIKNLDKQKVAAFEKVFRKYNGYMLPKVIVVDIEQDIKLEFNAVKKKVSISNELLKELEELGFSYQLN